MNSIARYLNKIIFSFNFLNQQDIDACTQNRNTLYALYAKSMAVIFYFTIAVFSISKMFIFSLKWNESSAYGVGVCLALLLTILLTNVISDSRERLGNWKFYFRLIQMVVFVLSFFGFSQLYASNGMTINQQQDEHLKIIQKTHAELGSLQREQYELIDERSRLENKISENQTLPRAIKRIYANDSDGKRRFYLVPNKKVVDEYNVLMQQLHGVNERLKSIESTLDVKIRLIKILESMDNRCIS